MVDEFETPKRLPRWEARLMDFIRDTHGKAFAWGERDCALWACDAVLAFTGVDLAADLRGRYDTEIGAGRAIIECGYKGLLDMCEVKAARHRIEECRPAFAWRGDVGFSSVAGGALSIAVGQGWGTMTRDRGYQVVPFSLIERAWRIA